MSGLVGRRLGAYELLERVGGGGMAEVYRARQLTAFGREVAIKVILPEYSQESTFRARFLREAEAISRLSHPHILPLIEAGEEQATLYLVMPLVREGTLRDLLQQRGGPLALEEALPLFCQLCSAVHYAHSQGIIHRDIKPQNVLLQQGTHVLLADFGIARSRAQQEQLTRTGTLIGSAAYMAPEQVLGQADALSDIYSLGVVLYEMVTGRLPYEGATAFELIVKHSSDPIPDPRSSNPVVPPALADIIQTALAKNPQERFQSAIALRQAVQQSTGGGPSSALATPSSSAPAAPAPPQITAASRAAATDPSSALPLMTNPSDSDVYQTRPARTTPAAGPATSMERATPTIAVQPGALLPSSGAGIHGPALAGGPGVFPGATLPPASGAANAISAPGLVPAPPIAPPHKNRRAGVRIFSMLVALLLLGGTGVVLARWLSSGGGSAGTHPTPTPSAFLTYTSQNQTFTIRYPRGWTQQPASAGIGAHFEGPGDASFDVVNQGATTLDAGSAVDLFCLTISGVTGGQKTITLGGQRWVQEDCGESFDGNHAVVEIISYQGSLYMMAYAAPPASFADVRARYFSVMEQSFTFLI